MLNANFAWSHLSTENVLSNTKVTAVPGRRRRWPLCISLLLGTRARPTSCLSSPSWPRLVTLNPTSPPSLMNIQLGGVGQLDIRYWLDLDTGFIVHLNCPGWLYFIMTLFPGSITIF